MGGVAWRGSEEPGLDGKWFAVRVRTRYEKKVASSLDYRGIDSFLPVYRANRKWSDRVAEIDLPLFPSYVFGRFDPSSKLNVLTVPGVIEIVGNGASPTPVDNFEIAAQQAAVRSGFMLTPWPFLKIGESVRLVAGPLRNVTGILTAFKGDRKLILSVTLLQRSVAVSVDRAWVQPAA